MRKGLVLSLALVLIQACAALGLPETMPVTQPMIPALTPPPTLTRPTRPTHTPTKFPAAATHIPSPIASIPTNTPCANASINLVAFFPDSERILQTLFNDGHYAAQIILARTGEEQRRIDAPYAVEQTALSPDGGALAWALDDHAIHLVSLPDGKPLALLEGHIDRITALEYTPSGERLYSASLDRSVRIWSSAGEWLGTFRPTGADDIPAEILGMGVAPDGELLATIPFDGPVKLWDLAHSRKAGEFTGAISGGYDGSGAVFSPDGQYLAVSLGGGGALSLWRLSDGAELWRGGVAAAQFSPDGSLFAYADFGSTGEGLVILRSAHGQQVVRSWETGLGMVWRILFSLDGRLLATTDGQQARLWQVDDGRLLQTWRAVCP